MGDVNPLRRLRAVPDDAAETGVELDAENLLRRAGRGDEAAFSDFYDLTSGLVYGIVVKVVRDPAMAQEVSQEVFVELWRLAPRFDASRGSARAWTSTVAHRRAVDRVRSEQARRSREDADSRQAMVSFDEVSEAVVDDADRRLVRDALSSLSETQRQAVTLAYYGGHTYREVAALLDVPEGTVKTRIRDGLVKLRDTFGVGP